MADVTCPRCGTINSDLNPIGDALKEKIREGGNTEDLPDELCDKCLAEVAGKIARGSILVLIEKAREKQKMMLWKSRVQLMKRAHIAMKNKMFSDAAIAYEKYLKVLELIFEVKDGELSPELFKDGAKTKELTIITNSYWDLVKIYDGNGKYRDRQLVMIKKLAQFVQFTPIYGDIVKKVNRFMKTAKNPGNMKLLLREMHAEKKGCFIATATFSNPFSPEVMQFRYFRDNILQPRPWGRFLIFLYYRISPTLAGAVVHSHGLQRISKWVLTQIATQLAKRRARNSC